MIPEYIAHMDKFSKKIKFADIVAKHSESKRNSYLKAFN